MPKTRAGPSFKAELQKEGYSEKMIEELWKWYDYEDKKKGGSQLLNL
jgi:hypothetical protein